MEGNHQLFNPKQLVQFWRTAITEASDTKTTDGRKHAHAISVAGTNTIGGWSAFRRPMQRAVLSIQRIVQLHHLALIRRVEA